MIRNAYIEMQKKIIDKVTLELNKAVEKLSIAKVSVEKFKGSKSVAEEMLNAKLKGKYDGVLGILLSTLKEQTIKVFSTFKFYIFASYFCFSRLHK